MRIPRIFTDQELTVAQTVRLDAFASGHICRVLRMKEGRQLILFNDQGGEYSAVLEDADPKAALVEIMAFDAVDRESNLQIHLGLALSRGDRFDWAIQKSVELGVTSITPLYCERSDKITDTKRLERKMDHWKKLIVSASEQSGRTAIAKIFEPQNCQQWCRQNEQAKGYFFSLDKPNLSQFLTDQNQASEQVRLAIGPEGGFSETEEVLLQEQGFQAVSLGARVLRTETAPVVAIGLFQYLLGDLG